MDINALRKSRSTDYSAVTSAMNKIANPQQGRQEDKRFWQLEGDEAGNGSAVIRFLHVSQDIKPDADELPWVSLFSYGFKGPTGKWYIENSRTTLGEKDPVSEANNVLWETGTKENQDIVRNRRRRLSYISNILVINDPKHPENNGKVFLFRYGKKIFDKIMDKANPDPAFNEKPVHVYDIWNGADFKLRMRKVEGFTNWDKSEFVEPSELAGGDEQKILEIINSMYKLSEFVAPDQFKSYDELKRRLDVVLGIVEDSGSAPARPQPSKPAATVEDDDIPFVPDPEPAKSQEAPSPASAELGDDDMAFFQQIAESSNK
jgi:hypothetical protein